MKKILIIFLFIFAFTISANAQTIQWYRTTGFASQTYNYYTERWNDWSEWESSKLNIKFDLLNDVIVIYSPQTQVYSVYSVSEPYNDNQGGRQIKFNARDSDGDRVDIRLRIESNGNSQIYVDYADARWVYNVIRTSLV